MQKYSLIIILIGVFFCNINICCSEPCVTEGTNIGNLEEVIIYANSCNLNTRWQCVEFAKRFYFYYHHYNIVKSYNGEMNMSGIGSTWHMQNGLITCYNTNTTEIPDIGDTIAFATNKNDPHVAIVSKIDSSKIYFYQQNWSYDGNQYTTGSVNYNINPTTGIIKADAYGSYNVLGWGKPEFSVPVFSRDNSNYNAVYGIKGKVLYSKIKVKIVIIHL